MRRAGPPRGANQQPSTAQSQFTSLGCEVCIEGSDVEEENRQYMNRKASLDCPSGLKTCDSVNISLGKNKVLWYLIFTLFGKYFIFF